MNVRDIAARWRLHRSGREWRGECPACGYPASFILSIGRDGRAIGWCANCQDRAAIVAALRAFDFDKSPAPQAAAQSNKEREDQAKKDRAIALWNGASPVPGTPAEAYLRSRCIGDAAFSSALRFRPDTPHPQGGRLPAMLARIDDPDGKIIALHRTFLKPDGSAKADVEPAKATLGHLARGAIHLSPIASELVIGEGIETTAAAGKLLGLPAWAAVSAGNMAQRLVLPAQVRAVVIAVDRDHYGERAANEAAWRWQREGRRVLLMKPKRAGADAADLIAQGRPL